MSLLGKAREIDTRRLHLRALKIEDAEQMFGIYSDTEVMKYWACEPVEDLAGAQKMVQEDIDWDASGKSINWAITLASSGEVIGKCILFEHDKANLRAEVGYILKQSFWRQGLAFEAMVAAINFAFEELGVHRLEADTDPDNTGSLGLLKKLGFRHEGLFRERWFVYGQWQDSAMLGLIKKDWTQGNSRSK